MTSALLEQPVLTVENPAPVRGARLWKPERALFTPAALEEAWGRQIFERVSAAGIATEVLPANRLTGLRGADERQTYNRAKRTLAVVTAPPSAFKLTPIPPSADWQFHSRKAARRTANIVIWPAAWPARRSSAHLRTCRLS